MTEKKFDFFYNKRILNIILILIPVIIGIVYISFQWVINRKIQDFKFVIILITANILLIQGLIYISRYVSKNSINFFKFTLKTEDTGKIEKESSDFLNKIFNYKFMTISGFAYGSLVAFAPVVIKSVWLNNNSLKILLSVFLFTINFVTGVSVYSLIVFFIHSIKLGTIVKVELWNRENISTNFIRNTAYRVSLIGS